MEISRFGHEDLCNVPNSGLLVSPGSTSLHDTHILNHLLNGQVFGISKTKICCFFALKEMSRDIESFNENLLHRPKKTTDLRLTYAKYLAIQKMIEDVGVMERGGTWTHQKPTVGDIAEVFMSKSGYIHRPHQLFPKVVDGSEMQKWLKGGEEAPAESDVWGDKKPSFKNLNEILDGKKKKVTSHKRKQKD